MSTPTPVAAFWRWWTDEGEHHTTSALDRGDTGELTRLIGERIDPIDAGLAWELAPGTRARHALVVTSGGISALRPTAERWYRAAPPATPTWEYHPARQADATVTSLQVVMAGHRVSLGDVSVVLATDTDEGRVDVGVHHPAFAVLPERACKELTFLALDRLLGEDDVERWIGAVDVVVAPPADGTPLGSLAEAVAVLRRDAPTPTWHDFGGVGPDGVQATLSILRPRRWIDHPLLDLHHLVVLGYADADDGLPTPAALVDLDARRQELLAATGGRATLLAVETGAHRRAWHLYGDGDDRELTAAIERWCADHGASHVASPDPAWRDLRDLP